MISGYLSQFSLRKSLHRGSLGYPEPHSMLYFFFIFSTSLSRVTLARMDAAATGGWRSPLCSHRNSGCSLR